MTSLVAARLMPCLTDASFSRTVTVLPGNSLKPVRGRQADDSTADNNEVGFRCHDQVDAMLNLAKAPICGYDCSMTRVTVNEALLGQLDAGLGSRIVRFGRSAGRLFFARFGVSPIGLSLGELRR